MLVRLPTLLDLGVQPLSGPSRVLLCGEADFSYAAALCATQRGAIEVTATAFEEEMELHERYPRAAEALARVRAAGARCDFGVDARELSRRYPSEEWDRVVFNLPQAPPEPRRRNQIQRQRALLRDFCAAAASVLSRDGQIWVTLLAGQGGTRLDPNQRAIGDSWQARASPQRRLPRQGRHRSPPTGGRLLQVQLAAAQAGLLLVSALEVRPPVVAPEAATVSPGPLLALTEASFPSPRQADLGPLAELGYVPGGRGIRRAARVGPVRPLVSHVLVREGDGLDSPSSRAAAAACAGATRAVLAGGVAPRGASGAREAAAGVSRLEFDFDNAFWLDGAPRSPAELHELCRAALAPAEAHVLRTPPSLIDEWESAEGRPSRTYRFSYSSSTLALSRQRALDMNRRVCEAVAAAGAGRPRTPSVESLAELAAAAALRESSASSSASSPARSETPHERS